MKTRTTRRFRQHLQGLNRQDREVILRAIEKFIRNPGLPGLNLEKLSGTPNDWSIRASIKVRILLTKLFDEDGEDVWIFTDAGSHEIYKRR